MNQNLTELVFILDMSGSMGHLTDDTVGGFNSVLKEQANKDGEVFVTTYLFNNNSRMLHDRLPIGEVPAMTNADYRAAGCTALIDALGDAIRHIVSIHRYARPEDIPGHTIFVVTTDGMENASHRYSSDEVKAMVNRQKEKYGWEFLFLGANIDAVETAARFGITEDRAVDFINDRAGQALNYAEVSEAVRTVRACRPLTREWKGRIEADYKARK